MGIFSQFHDGAQFKFYPHVAQRYYKLLDGIQRTFVKSWSSLLNNDGNLNVQLIMFLSLAIGQYGKAFSLSATPVAY